MSTDFPDWYQAELNSTADDASVRQTIAKPTIDTKQVLAAVLQGQIDVLLALNYTTAYTGSLAELKPSSYVIYADVLKVLNEKRKMLNSLQNSR